MSKSSSIMTYHFTQGTTVEMEPGIYGLMPDDAVSPQLTAWALNPALDGPQKLLERTQDMALRPAICAVPGPKALFACVLDPKTQILHVEARAYRDSLTASGAALTLCASMAGDINLSDLLPMLDPLDETMPSEGMHRSMSYEEA